MRAWRRSRARLRMCWGSAIGIGGWRLRPRRLRLLPRLQLDSAWPPTLTLLSHHVVQNVFCHVNRQRRVAGDGDRDGVAGAGVDLDELAVVADAELREVRVLAELADHDVLK